MQCSRERESLPQKPIVSAEQPMVQDTSDLSERNTPVKSEKVEGELYKRYWIDEEYLASLKRPLNERIKTFFDDLLKGGMFEEARV